MSETNDKPRGRRRAMRSAGPPPAEGGEFSDAASGGAGSGAADGTGAGSALAATSVVADSGSGAAAKATTGSKGEGGFAEDIGSADAGTPAPDAVKAKPAASEGLAKPAGKKKPVALDKDDDETPVAEPTERRRSWKRPALTAAAAILALAIVVSAVLSTLAVRATDARDERRAEYTQTARQTILNLTTIRADSAKEDIDRILSVASGDFKTEFDGRVDPFTDIVQQAKVVSTGEIVESALERDDENSAQVLVAAKQTLTNAGQAEPQTRYYRFRVTVARGDDGLTASKVEFVA